MARATKKAGENEELNAIKKEIRQYIKDWQLVRITKDKFDNEIKNGVTKFEKKEFAFAIDLSTLPELEFNHCIFRKIKSDKEFPKYTRENDILVKLRFDFCKFFNPLSFTIINFKKPVYFISCTFYFECQFEKCFLDEVYFHHSNFKKQVFFSGDFKKSSGFSNSYFEDVAYFNLCDFIGDVDFSMSIFYKSANYEYAEFRKKVKFRYTKFKSQVNFSEAKFSGETLFAETLFLGPANFSKTLFWNLVDTSSVNKEYIYGFIKAIFGDEANFSGAKFVCNICFNHVQFKKDIYFQQCYIIGDVELKFELCNFDGLIDIQYINYFNEVYNYSKISTNNNNYKQQGHLIFSQSVIKGLINLKDSFLEKLDLIDNSIQDYVLLPNEDNIKYPSRSYYQIAKHQKIQEHNQIDALALFAKEKAKHVEELEVQHVETVLNIKKTKNSGKSKAEIAIELTPYKIKSKKNFEERLLLFFSSFTNYGASWARGIAFFAWCLVLVSFGGAFLYTNILPPLPNFFIITTYLIPTTVWLINKFQSEIFTKYRLIAFFSLVLFCLTMLIIILSPLRTLYKLEIGVIFLAYIAILGCAELVFSPGTLQKFKLLYVIIPLYVGFCLLSLFALILLGNKKILSIILLEITFIILLLFNYCTRNFLLPRIQSIISTFLAACITILIPLLLPVIIHKDFSQLLLFIKYLFNIAVKLLYPLALFRDTNFAVGQITAWVVLKDFVKVAWSIFYAAMTWQIIGAFRKYSRSLE